MHIAILTHVKSPAWRVSIACPTAKVRSMNGFAPYVDGVFAAA